MKFYTLYFESPVGILEIQANQDSLVSISIVDKKKKSSKVIPFIISESYKQLHEYFEGKRTEFNLRIYLEGTDFQKSVWNELLKIPYGQIDTYKGVAEKIGNAKASRAIGNANNKNKLLIVVPCHRVISSSGNLNGYQGGLENKEWLLNHEKSVIKNM